VQATVRRRWLHPELHMQRSLQHQETFGGRVEAMPILVVIAKLCTLICKCSLATAP